MTTDLFSSARWLLGKETDGYGTWPIPHRVDAEITGLMQAWMEQDEPKRKAVAEQIKEEQRFLLLAYSERMASLAVRNHDRDLILLGLVALGVDGWQFDWRENMVLLCLHYDASRRIGAAPADLFEEAAQLLPKMPADALRSFLRRSEEGRSLAAMGYVAAADADGFRYQRTW